MNPTLKALGGTAMPVGAPTGETVSNLLISSVAATTQALETWSTSATEPQTTLRMSLAQILKIICYILKHDEVV